MNPSQEQLIKDKPTLTPPPLVKREVFTPYDVNE